MNIICFHNPNEENGYLSNWYPAHFTVDGIEFSSMEQFMMYQKACRFHDASVAKEILSTNDVAEIKKLGREVHGYNENTWNGVPSAGVPLAEAAAPATHKAITASKLSKTIAPYPTFNISFSFDIVLEEVPEDTRLWKPETAPQATVTNKIGNRFPSCSL